MEMTRETIKTMEDVSVEKLLEIPKLLFDEIASSYSLYGECPDEGNGTYAFFKPDDKRKVMNKYRLKEVAIITFIGSRNSKKCIGQRGDDKSTEFLLWDSIPKGEDSIFEPEILLKIISGDLSYNHDNSYIYKRGVFIEFNSPRSLWHHRALDSYLGILEKLKGIMQEIMGE